MTLRLYYHPLSSFCQKALIALYERDVGFEPVLINLGAPADRAALQALWPLGKFPVLRDEAAGVTVAEASLIVEYVDRVGAGDPFLVPTDPAAALPVRLWDRFLDNYVHLPMQRVVGESFRPAESKDAYGVEEAKRQIARSWEIFEDHLAATQGEWAAGATFTLADCAAAPALFYANIVQPFAGHTRLEAYFDRLRARPSFARCIKEAKPYWDFFPLEWPESYL